MLILQILIRAPNLLAMAAYYKSERKSKGKLTATNKQKSAWEL